MAWYDQMSSTGMGSEGYDAAEEERKRREAAAASGVDVLSNPAATDDQMFAAMDKFGQQTQDMAGPSWADKFSAFANNLRAAPGNESDYGIKPAPVAPPANLINPNLPASSAGYQPQVGNQPTPAVVPAAPVAPIQPQLPPNTPVAGGNGMWDGQPQAMAPALPIAPGQQPQVMPAPQTLSAGESIVPGQQPQLGQPPQVQSMPGQPQVQSMPGQPQVQSMPGQQPQLGQAPQPALPPERMKQLATLANPNATIDDYAQAMAMPDTPPVEKQQFLQNMVDLDRGRTGMASAKDAIAKVQTGQATPKEQRAVIKEMTTPTPENDGSYVRAWGLLMLGMKDEAINEMGKLGLGLKQEYQMVDGRPALVTTDGNGRPLAKRTVWADSGKPLSGEEMAQLSQPLPRGIHTGNTTYTMSDGGTAQLANDGNYYRNGRKLMGVTPTGTLVGQQSLTNAGLKKEMGSNYKTADAMIKENLDASKVGVPKPYSDEQIAAAKRGEAKPGVSSGSINNNPGNIMYGDRAIAMGATGRAPNGTAIFPNMAAGDAAQDQLLSSDAYKNMNLHQIISKWAPNNENNPAQYARTVKGMLGGIDMDKTYNELSPQEKQTFREVQYRVEHGAAASTTTGSGTAGEDNSVAAKIARYEMKMPASRSASYGPLMKEVMRINPAYDETQYNVRNKTATAFATGKEGQTVRSMNVAIDHLDTLGKAADALNNSDFTAVNRIINPITKALGMPEVTDFEGMKSIVGSEVAKAVSGSQMALEDRKEIRDVLASWQSPAQTAGVVKRLQDLLGGQVKGLKKQYTSAGFKDEDFNKKLLPKTLEVIKETEQRTQGGPQQVTSQAQFDALPSGTVYTGRDGKQYRKP